LVCGGHGVIVGSITSIFDHWNRDGVKRKGNHMKITDSVWFTGIFIPGCIGIVLSEDDITGKKKAYEGAR
jgi:hypothetical protein